MILCVEVDFVAPVDPQSCLYNCGIYEVERVGINMSRKRRIEVWYHRVVSSLAFGFNVHSTTFLFLPFLFLPLESKRGFVSYYCRSKEFINQLLKSQIFLR